jgi:RNA polymerase sigma-70 factor (ECF subfamily)
MLVQGRHAFPGVLLPPEALREHVEGLAVDEARLVRHATDLFLVAAVLTGQTAALRHFDHEVTRAAKAAARIDPAEPFLDEVGQELKMRLLSGPEARLRSYAATGSLKDWLRVAALRVGLNLKRGNRLVPAPELELEHLLDPSEPPGAERRYLTDFKEAIEASLAALTPHERTLLRLHFVDGMNIDRIGVIYSAHRATVARWLVRIRGKVFERAKAELGERHGLRTADVKSLYRALQGDVHASVSRILRT